MLHRVGPRTLAPYPAPRSRPSSSAPPPTLLLVVIIADCASSDCHRWEHNKHENIMTFRDKSHTSLMTRSKAPQHHTPWLAAFDDTAESYVAKNKEAALKLNS